MGNLSGLDKYSEYGEGEIQGGATFFIILKESLSFLILFSISKFNLKVSFPIKTFYVMAPLFTIFAPLIQVNGAMIRITLYFSLFLCLLVPYAIDCRMTKIGI